MTYRIRTQIFGILITRTDHLKNQCLLIQAREMFINSDTFVIEVLFVIKKIQ